MSASMEIIDKIALKLNLSPRFAGAAAALLDDGATIPFVARYRKEATGGMDEVALIALRDALSVQRELEDRLHSILTSLTERNILNPALEAKLRSANTRTALEDFYLPYRPKRRTRAMAAREAGFQGLADEILTHQNGSPNLRPYPEPKGALAGARDILAEGFSENPQFRQALRNITFERGSISAAVVPKLKDEEGAAVYRNYFSYAEGISKAPSHRILAILRGRREGFLRVKARLDNETALAWLEKRIIKGRGECALQLKEAVQDAWGRLIAPSLENDVLNELKARSDAEAIRIFAANLEIMLLAPPLGRKRVIALDPGFRTGGKLVVLDAQGKLLEHDVIYPTGSKEAQEKAVEILKNCAKKYDVKVFAVGNGTAGRETEEFIRKAFPGLSVISVDERGASVYSASEEARQEFGHLDITVRGAVSIGRRLQDPLAELVKIEPESIGIGQYQHDVDPKALAQTLDDTVRSAVNAVGVELNTASAPLLSRVSGLGPKLARAIVEKRQSDGPFQSRRDLLKVPRLGAKVFEQAASFLRISGAAHPLDASAVHPERYSLVEKMAADLGLKISDMLSAKENRDRIRPEDYVGFGEGNSVVGIPTIKDILAELARPGKDPRGEFQEFRFDERIRSFEDVQPGMTLPGIVTNVTAFGAFVDIGAHGDALVHISELANRYVADPSEVVSVHDIVTAKVLEVDAKRGRISLTMKDLAD